MCLKQFFDPESMCELRADVMWTDRQMQIFQYPVCQLDGLNGTHFRSLGESCILRCLLWLSSSSHYSLHRPGLNRFWCDDPYPKRKKVKVLRWCRLMRTTHWPVKKNWTQWTHFSFGILALWWSLAPGIAAMWAWLLGTISVSSATWHWEGGIRWLHYCKCLAPVTRTNTPTHLCLLAYLFTY